MSSIRTASSRTARLRARCRPVCPRGLARPGGRGVDGAGCRSAGAGRLRRGRRIEVPGAGLLRSCRGGPGGGDAGRCRLCLALRGRCRRAARRLDGDRARAHEPGHVGHRAASRSRCDVIDEPPPTIRRAVGLHAAVARSIALHHAAGGVGRCRRKDGSSTGRSRTAMRPLQEKTGARYALFIWVRDSYASAERKAAMVAMAMLGVGLCRAARRSATPRWSTSRPVGCSGSTGCCGSAATCGERQAAPSRSTPCSPAFRRAVKRRRLARRRLRPLRDAGVVAAGPALARRCLGRTVAVRPPRPRDRRRRPVVDHGPRGERACAAAPS